MKILITGSNGFIGKNLRVACSELGFKVIEIDRNTTQGQLVDGLKNCEIVIHLAGTNRPVDPIQFQIGNADYTQMLCDTISNLNLQIPVIYSSSIQAELVNPYGDSKLKAESIIAQYALKKDIPFKIYRFPNVFGKWAKPNYNSAVATFCHSIANGFEYSIHDRKAKINLIYIDDVVKILIDAAHKILKKETLPEIEEYIYQTTVGEIADTIENFSQYPKTLEVGNVGTGLNRALYSTYISYLPTNRFSCPLRKFSDSRGDFVEMLKTPNAGQFSYFTALPGITRGGHYHHTKSEKFLVISGKAEFKFRNILTDEHFKIFTDGAVPTVVDTVPGWAHDITNVGSENLVVMLWANEKFDRDLPDTYATDLS
jgi:UDP-2-acetamido-2,6-beta-L-arabino-hexul-4-ose reductase